MEEVIKICRLGYMNFVSLFLPSRSAKMHKKKKKSKLRGTKCEKMADFAFLEPPILISRKI